jgi:hypothetical protein
MATELYNPSGLVQPDGPPYIGKKGRKITKALFWHHYRNSPKSAPYLPVFVLRHDWDSRNVFDKAPGVRPLIEVYSTFLEMDDPTGYEWAMTYLKNYDTYKRILDKYPEFKACIDEATDEILHRKKSKAFKRLEQVMEDGSDSQALAAAKYLLEEGWKKKASNRGRPSKDEVQGELKHAAKLSREEMDDMARIGLVVDNTKEVKDANGSS